MRQWLARAFAGARISAEQTGDRVVRKVARQLAEVVCPKEIDGLELGDAVVDHLVGSIAAMPGEIRLVLRGGLLAYELGALPRSGKRASTLDRAQARRYFARWQHGSAIQRQFIHAVRGLLLLAYYEMPAVQARLDYHPAAWMATVARRRLERHGLAIARHQADLHAPDPLIARSPGESTGHARMAMASEVAQS